MRASRVGGLLLGLLVLAACSGPQVVHTQADQERDAQVVANALRQVDLGGAHFDMDNQLAYTGGSVPAGQEVLFQSSSTNGTFKEGQARFAYRFMKGTRPTVYDMVVDESRLFVKSHASSAWKMLPAGDAAVLLPLARLETLRQTVLLAGDVGGATVSLVGGALYRKYRVTPAPAQLEQLQGVVLTGRDETTFLKTASGEVDLFLTLADKQLARAEVHLRGMDPQSHTAQMIDSSINIRPSTVGEIQAPPTATAIQVSDFFNI
jgi:hypothetical protein